MDLFIENEDKDFLDKYQNVLPEEAHNQLAKILSSKNKASQVANAFLRVKENDIGNYSLIDSIVFTLK